MKATIIVVLLVLYSYTEAQVHYEPDNPNIKHNGWCYAQSFKIEMSKGEKKKVPERCGQMTCLEDKGIYYEYCDLVYISPPCRLTYVDPLKPWGYCCPRPICPE